MIGITLSSLVLANSTIAIKNNLLKSPIWWFLSIGFIGLNPGIVERPNLTGSGISVGFQSLE